MNRVVDRACVDRNVTVICILQTGIRRTKAARLGDGIHPFQDGFDQVIAKIGQLLVQELWTGETKEMACQRDC